MNRAFFACVLWLRCRMYFLWVSTFYCEALPRGVYIYPMAPLLCSVLLHYRLRGRSGEHEAGCCRGRIRQKLCLNKYIYQCFEEAHTRPPVLKTIAAPLLTSTAMSNKNDLPGQTPQLNSSAGNAKQAKEGASLLNMQVLCETCCHTMIGTSKNGLSKGIG